MTRPAEQLVTGRARVYGVRSRLRRIRKEGPADPSLLRWYPTWQLLDPHAIIDLTSPWEQAWVTRWMAEERRGVGEVVELGTWIGAMSRALTRGLARRPSPVTRIHAYDTFRFEDVEGRVAGTPLEGRYRNGMSFRELYADRLGPDLARVQVHEGDILDAGWGDRPIEFLFIDLAKTWDTWCHVRATFFPTLVDGAIVVQQDWAHACTPWLHLWHHRWRDHLEPLGHIIHSSSVPFRLVAALPPEALAADGPADYPPAEVRDAFAWAASLVAPNERAHIAGAEVMLHALQGSLDDGMAALVRWAVTGPVAGELASIAIPELARRVIDGDRLAGRSA